MKLRHATTTALLLLAAATVVPAQPTPHALMQTALYKQQIEGDLREAARLFQQLADEYGEDRAVAARALVLLGRVRETMGSGDATAAYRRVVRDYPEQLAAVKEAEARLAILMPANAISNPEGLVARHLLTHPNAGFIAGAVSPDGRHVVFTDWAGIEGVLPIGTGALVSRDAITGASIVLARAGADAKEEKEEVYVTGSIWSADGRRVAYSIWDESWDHQRLHIVDADGANDRVVSNNTQHKEIQPGVWSAARHSIFAFITGWDARQRIAEVSVADGTVRILKTLPATKGQTPRSLSLSPDGRYLVYTWADEDGADNDLFVLAVDGSRETRLAANPANDQWPFWTPDGRRILFLSTRSGQNDLWAIEMNDGRAAGEPVLIRPGVGQIRLSGFVDDGALTYQQSISQSDVHVARMEWERATIAEAGRLGDRFVGNTGRGAWSPDGQRIAYMASRDAPYLVIRSLRDGSEKDINLAIMGGVGNETAPAWSGDGKSVLLVGRQVAEGRKAWRVDVETGRIEREQYMLDDASAFGSRFATGRQSAALRDMGIRIVGLRDHRYYRLGGEAMRSGERILWVRDGIRWVHAWNCDAPAPAGAECLDVVPVEYTVTPVTHDGSNYGWDLSPDGRSIALGLGLDMQSAPRALWVWSIAGADPPRKVMSVGADESIGSIRWNQDGTYVLVEVMDPKRDEQTRVLRVRVVDGAAQAVTLAEGQTRLPLGSVAFSPDGTQMLYSVATYRDEVWALSGFSWQRGPK